MDFSTFCTWSLKLGKRGNITATFRCYSYSSCYSYYFQYYSARAAASARVASKANVKEGMVKVDQGIEFKLASRCPGDRPTEVV